MCAFFRKSVPYWASFFNKDEYAAFTKALDDYFKGQGIKYSLGEGSAEVDERHFGHKNIGLLNLAQRCKSYNISEYPRTVASYFNAVREAMEFDREFRKIENDFEKVKEYIGVRLYDNGYMAHLGKDKAIGRDVAENLYAMLVFDLPQSVVNVPLDKLGIWAKGKDELFELGLQNIRQKYPLHMQREDGGGFYIWHVNNDHFFSSNIIFEMEQHPGLVGTHGALVGLPHRYSALIYPIENLEVVDAINLIIPATAGMCAEGPGSLSSNVYWYKNGKLTDLPYSFKRDKLDFMPPPDFARLLNSLENPA